MNQPASTLTDAKLKAPSEGRVEHPDDKVPGLRVRISSKGSKTFILRKRQGDKLHNFTLGVYGHRFTQAEARGKARALLNDLEAGLAPPTAQKRSPVSKGTVGALLPAYLESKTHLRSHRETKRILENYVMPKLGDRLADTVTRGEITALIDEIAQTAPTMARAVHAQLSAFYTWVLPRLDRLQGNPCRDAGRPAKSKARDRVLSDVDFVPFGSLPRAKGSHGGLD